MVNVDLQQATFDLTLTLGSADTENPPPLLLSFIRKGTNHSGSQVLSETGMETGINFITYVDIPTSIFPESGQYSFWIYDNTVPSTPVLIEKGLLIATTEAITKKDYGTDKERGEYKGHL